MTGFEMFFGDAGEATVDADGLVWSTVLPVGEWKYRPGPGGRAVAKPIRVIEGRSANADYAIGLTDLLDAFDDGAMQYVTVPKSHADGLDENTGYVRKLRIEHDPRIGKTALRAGVQFTEPDVLAKVQRGTYAGRSAGLKFNYIDKESGKTYPVVLDHMALTNKPWIKGMPGALGFSETFVHEREARALTAHDVQDAVCDQLDEWTGGQTELVALKDGVATVRDADGDAWSVPVRVDGSAVRVEEPNGWVLARPNDRPKGGDMKTADQMTEAELRDALAARDAELSVLRAKDRESEVDARVEELKAAGFSEDAGYSGFLVEVRNLMLADDGGPAAVLLSENGRSEQPYTVTEIVERLIGALPTDAGVGLSEQGSRRSAGKKPPADTQEEELTARERADLMRERLGIQKDLIAKP